MFNYKSNSHFPDFPKNMRQNKAILATVHPVLLLTWRLDDVPAIEWLMKSAGFFIGKAWAMYVTTIKASECFVRTFLDGQSFPMCQVTGQGHCLVCSHHYPEFI